MKRVSKGLPTRGQGLNLGAIMGLGDQPQAFLLHPRPPLPLTLLSGSQSGDFLPVRGHRARLSASRLTWWDPCCARCAHRTSRRVSKRPPPCLTRTKGDGGSAPRHRWCAPNAQHSRAFPSVEPPSWSRGSAFRKSHHHGMALRDTVLGSEQPPKRV